MVTTVVVVAAASGRVVEHAHEGAARPLATDAAAADLAGALRIARAGRRAHLGEDAAEPAARHRAAALPFPGASRGARAVAAELAGGRIALVVAAALAARVAEEFLIKFAAQARATGIAATLLVRIAVELAAVVDANLAGLTVAIIATLRGIDAERFVNFWSAAAETGRAP
jgi:hypothetical protein